MREWAIMATHFRDVANSWLSTEKIENLDRQNREERAFA